MAFYRAEEVAKQILPHKGTVLMTVAARDRAGALDVARELSRLGF
jgi:hypothetical protein